MVTTGFNERLFIRWSNAFAAWLANAPLLGKVVGRKLVVIRYVGRRSGKLFETPVAYSRRDGGVTIDVSFPDKKSWWRNFLGEGGPITLVGLDGAEGGDVVLFIKRDMVRCLRDPPHNNWL